MGIWILLGILPLPIGAAALWHVLTRLAENRRLRNPRPDVSKEESSFGAGAFIALLLLPCIGVVIVLLPEDARAGAALLGVIMQAWSFGLHVLPNHDRLLKYGLMLSGMQFLAAGISRSREVAGSVVLVSAASILFAALFCTRYFKPNQALSPSEPGTVRTVRWYRRLSWMQGTDVPSVIVWSLLSISQLGSLYFIARAMTKRRLGTRPFVYLRAFSSTDIPVVFSKVVAPVINRYGVLSGLVHERQHSIDLQRAVPLFWRSRLAIVPDVQWRAWVERELARAAGAIIDVSAATESVRWEVERAIEILGADQVFLLYRRGETAAPWPSLLAQDYDTSEPTSLQTARVALSNWAQRSHQPLAPTAKQPIAIRPRYQIPVVVIISLLFAGLSVSTFVASAASARAQRAKQATAVVSARTIRLASEQWQLEHDSCPTVSDLVNERYLDAAATELDPWGNRYQISCNDEGYTVTSPGPDGRPGTADDVTVP